MTKIHIFHPLLFAVYPVLFLYSRNLDELSFYSIILPMSLIIIVTLISYYLLSLVLRNKIKRAIIISIILGIYFSYGHIYNILHNIYFPLRHRELLLFFIIILCASIILILKTRRNLYILNGFFNTVSIALVTVSLIHISVYYFSNNIDVKLNNSVEKRGASIAAKELNKEKYSAKPDIYYIILDEYTNFPNLKTFVNFDNSEFINFLSRKGFYVANESHSNYSTTFLSLSSSLNMQYINYFQETLGRDSKDRTLPNEMIKKNKVVNFLKSRGYKFYNFMSGWGPTAYNEYADIDINCGVFSELSCLIIKTTMLLPFAPHLIGGTSSAIAVDKLADVINIRGPKFVFAHIICPHDPIDSFSDAIDPSETVETKKKRYLERLILLNQRVESAVDNILSKSEIPPIIILQGDHGTNFTLGDPRNPQSGWNHPDDRMIRERMGILNAYYLPTSDKSFLYDSISPVNSFRFIFNIFLGGDFEILRDKSYFSSYDSPYKFKEVVNIN